MMGMQVGFDLAKDRVGNYRRTDKSNGNFRPDAKSLVPGGASTLETLFAANYVRARVGLNLAR